MTARAQARPDLAAEYKRRILEAEDAFARCVSRYR